MDKKILLAGDVGGTKTNLAFYEYGPDTLTRLTEATFASSNYPGLAELILEFMADRQLSVECACLGVAGPVIEGRATITKLPWVMAEKELESQLNIPRVWLINDLVATATAVPELPAADIFTLNKGRPEAGGPLAVIAPGTGLGEAFLTWNGSGYVAQASEGGHADFAPASETEIELLRFLRQRHEHVSYDWVCSGRGLPEIYEYLRQCRPAAEPDWLAAQLAATDDPAPVIVRAASEPGRPCELCRLTLDIFVSILGAEAGNLCLKVLATGGVYLGGGIPPRILDFLTPESFLPAFIHKGRLKEMMSRIPVHVILNPKTALQGAAIFAANLESQNPNG